MNKEFNTGKAINSMITDIANSPADEAIRKINEMVSTIDNFMQKMSKNSAVDVKFKFDTSDIEKLKAAQKVLEESKAKLESIGNVKGKMNYFTSQEDALNQLKNAWNNFAKDVGKVNMNNLTQDKSATAVLRWANSFEALEGNLKDIDPQIDSFVSKMRTLMNDKNPGYQYTKEQFQGLFNVFKNMNNAGIDVSAYLKSFDQAGNKVSEFAKLTEDAQKRLDNVRNDMYKNKESNSGVNVESDAKSVEKLIELFGQLKQEIEAIRTSFGTIDDESGLNVVAKSIQDINTYLSTTSNDVKELVQALSGVNLNLNLNLGGSGNNPITRNAIYGSEATKVSKQLSEVRTSLEDELKKYYNLSDGFNAVFKLFQGTDVLVKSGTDISNLYNGITQNSNKSLKMDSLKEYISLIKEAANIKGIDLSSVLNQYDVNAEKLVDDTKKILTGEKDASEGAKQLFEIFGKGTNVNLDGVVSQLDTMIQKLTEITTLLGQGFNVNGAQNALSQEGNLFGEVESNAQKAATSEEKFTKANQDASNSAEKAASSARDQANAFNDASKSAENMGSTLENAFKGTNGTATDKEGVIAFLKQMAALNNMELGQTSLKLDTFGSVIDDGVAQNVQKLSASINMVNKETKESATAMITWDRESQVVNAEITTLSKNWIAEAEAIAKSKDATTKYVGTTQDTLNKLKASYQEAFHPNSPVTNSDNLNELDNMISKVETRLNGLKSTGQSVSVEEQSNIKSIITNIEILIGSYQRAEKVKGQMSAETFENSKGSYTAMYDTLIDKVKRLGDAGSDLKNRMQEVKDSISSVTIKDGMDDIAGKYRTFSKEVSNLIAKTSQLTKFDKQMNLLNASGTDFSAYESSLQKLNQLLLEYKVTLGVVDQQDDMVWIDGQKDVKTYETEIDNLFKSLNNISSRQKQGWVTDLDSAGSVTSLTQVSDKIMDLARSENYGKMIGEQYNKSWNEVIYSFKNSDGIITKVRGTLNSTGQTMETLTTQTNGAVGLFGTFGSIMKKTAGYFTMYFTGYTMVTKVLSAFRDGLNTLKEYDQALTTMKYTMDLTKEGFDNLGQSAVAMANDLNTSLEDAMSIYQIYANMNENIESLNAKANPTLILSNLTGMGADNAATDVQAVLQAFNKTDDEIAHVVDVYDMISSNIAVDYSK